MADENTVKAADVQAILDRAKAEPGLVDVMAVVNLSIELSELTREQQALYNMPFQNYSNGTG